MDNVKSPSTKPSRSIIVMLGSAGSGKSTQSELLAKRTGYTWISTGKLLRESANEELQARLNTGELIDDALVLRVLTETISAQPLGSSCILDGFPRSVEQAGWLIKWCKDNNCRITAVIHLVVSRQVAIKRLTSRRRADDTDEAIAVRLKEYDTIIRQILADFAANGGVVEEVPADGTIADIDDEIIKRLGL